ncbi:MAG: pantoate--beta-alanine ligase [Planctomycetes bacterium]|nr:pantoate--beta-alanine ligase [Planctomycetota bacterium]
MIVLDTILAVQNALESSRQSGSVGFVPTMGCLHEGHLSLVKKCMDECDTTIVSIFINPTQFNDQQDFDTYPRETTADLKMLEELGVDMVFLPNAEDIFPKNCEISVVPGKSAETLCGLSRGGHFRGVLTVVAKLFNIVQPHISYFGAKDYQQFLLISKMVSDLNFPIELRLGDTVREEDGLAMSSRNNNLSVSEREEAPILYQALEYGEKQIRKGEPNALKVIEAMMTMIIENSSFSIDYLSIVDPVTLEDVLESSPAKACLIAIAANIGTTRLIDNILHLPSK